MYGRALPGYFGPLPMHCWCCGQPEQTSGCVRGFLCGCLFSRRCPSCSHCDLHCRCMERPDTHQEMLHVEGRGEVAICVRQLAASSAPRPLVEELAGTAEPGDWLLWVSQQPDNFAIGRTYERGRQRLADKLALAYREGERRRRE